MKKFFPIIFLSVILFTACSASKDKTSKQPVFLNTFSTGLINLDKVQTIRIVKHAPPKDGDDYWVIRAYFSVMNNEYVDFDARKEEWRTMEEYQKICSALNCIRKAEKSTVGQVKAEKPPLKK